MYSSSTGSTCHLGATAEAFAAERLAGLIQLGNRRCLEFRVYRRRVFFVIPRAADHFHYPGLNAVEKPASHWN
jgi:hypothetical protein